jgi:GT2 family glycosyltransferase/SAM-dependent methyltransferase
MTPNQQDQYNAIYYAHSCGEPYEHNEAWMGVFNNIADHIINELHPRSVLDAGCAMGFLVEALRKRGVEAWGVDVSEYAIQNVLPDFQPYCKVGLITELFPYPHYDLITCIEVIEHLTAEEAVSAIKNICKHSDDILLSSSPFDFKEPTHINVQSPEYWVALFNRFGFIHDIDFDASFIAPWAMRFVKAQPPIENRISTYERKIWHLSQEISRRRDLSVEYKKEIAQKEMSIQYWKAGPQRLQSELDEIRNSTSWRIITHFQRLRERIIPPGSRREAAMRSIFRGIYILRREGVVRFLFIAYHHFRRVIKLQLIRLKLRYSFVPNPIQICEIESVVNSPRVEPHIPSVDIIICIHEALDDVKRCLDSLFEHTTQPYNLILVDDGSSEETARYLKEFEVTRKALLLRSEKATGYTYAANRGMRASSAEFIALLNSDTILTPEWLDRLVSCIQGGQRIGIVGPLSNTASWQSVPIIEDNGDWASNTLPKGITPASMAQIIANNSARLHLEMPFLNGFCLLLRRALLDEVGYFDEDNFGQGYGEEDDLVIRARNKGWKMALADDVYIYHAQSKSYSNNKRKMLAGRAGKILRSKHGDEIIQDGIRYCKENPVLDGIRARFQPALDRTWCIHEGRKFEGKKILFVLPINNPGGGANVIRSESFAMQKMGVNITFFNLESNRIGFKKAYSNLCGSTIFGQVEDFQTIAPMYDAVIATFNPTVAWLQPILSRERHPVLAYYVQGFEPWMYPEGSPEYNTALDSYSLIKDIILFTKTDWTREQIKTFAGRDCEVIGASIDIDLYRPRPHNLPKWPYGPIRVAAMIRPESPYREPDKTMQLLKMNSRKFKRGVENIIFGTHFEDPLLLDLPQQSPWKLYGILTPEQVANLLNQVDIFIDYSSQQAMGLTAMEAMACGCAVIVPQCGGASSYAVHERNSLIIDTSSFENVWTALQSLIDDEKLRNHLQHNAIHDICAYFPELAALNILKLLFK